MNRLQLRSMQIGIHSFELLLYSTRLIHIAISCCVLSEFVPHDQVVAQLAADTLFSESSLGVDGQCFRPGSFPQLVTLCLKVVCASLLI